MLVDAEEIVSRHDEALVRWEAAGRGAHRARRAMEAALPDAAPLSAASLPELIEAEHFANFTIWGLEDEARGEAAGRSDAGLAAIKRAIDPWNQRRNDLMEAIDAAILAHYSSVDLRDSRLHSETAGMMIDRMSILALKLRAMQSVGTDAVAAGDRDTAGECERRAAVLRQQREDLATCLADLLEDFAAGRRHFKRYLQLKAYNDPDLNPVLRDAVRKSGDVAARQRNRP